MAVAAREAEPLLQVRGVSVRYGAVVALEGVDIDIRPGEILALAGENGAGKSTLVRCIAGDKAPDRGRILVHGHPLASDPRAAARLGVAVVWQDLALCENLDIASNLFLGRESRRMMISETRFHSRATSLLKELGIDLPPTATRVSNLSGGQRQLVAVAKAMRDRPRLLVLDEPTASLGVQESARVEELTASLPQQGTAVLLVTHEVDQMFRLADRIVILRRGRRVAEVDPAESHPDEIAALLSGQGVDHSARRQLTRLQSLADQLASAEPSSSLTLIMSALAAALGIQSVLVHVAERDRLRLAASMGLPSRLVAGISSVASGPAGGAIGRAIATGETMVCSDLRTDQVWSRHRVDTRQAGLQASWSVPFTGATGDRGVVTVLRPQPGEPSRGDLDLVALYAGYAASALERDRLLGEVTSRNRVLETIRDVLQALAGPAPFEVGLRAGLGALQIGLGASGVALVAVPADGPPVVRAWTGPGPVPDQLVSEAGAAGGQAAVEGVRADRVTTGTDGETALSIFPAPGGVAVLAATWDGPRRGTALDRRPLIDDATNSLRLALEREESERAQREAMALRSSQELQRRFLSWLSHELRTPLTAIRGYASSLMQPDVDWDGSSQQRFLERISDESARLGRLVDDLLDFSAIDAGILRLHPDWCDLALVLEAARECLPQSAPDQIRISCPEPTIVWADHDRLEQIFVNLLDNAVRHNPPGTSVQAEVSSEPAGFVTVAVTDDGVGLPTGMADGRAGSLPERRSRTGRAGLGLSIARGIVEAHGGRLEIGAVEPGTRCVVRIPVALDASADSGPEHERVASP
jgi:signal transduction histidine kinase/ABC-type multidrug transport system ATPase subunit